ncbi:MAG: hypothetical protein AB8B59_03305 [Maribacter sp.]
MKITIKSILRIGLGLCLLISSCTKGDQGDQGIPGVTGQDGIAGTNGTNGTDGEDGNANVIASDWVSLDFAASWDGNDEASFDITDSNITQEVIDSYALLGYTRFSSSTTTASAMPFISLGRQYEINNSMQVGAYSALALVNDRVARPSPPTNHQVRYILIAPSNISGKSSMPSLAKMKKDGVNTNDYTAVMDYFGLDY